MESALLYALGSTFIVSLVSLIGIFTISLSGNFLRKCLFFLVALAVGALLGDAFLHLIPEALEELGRSDYVFFFVLFGMFMFFLLEKIFRWHHHHGAHDAHHEHKEDCIEPVGPLVIFSDTAHNFIDGLVIGASFLISTELGVATTIAVLLHEIPQEMSDFALLIHAGYTKTKALLLNFATALVSLLGVFAVFLFSNVEGIIPILASITAGTFIYIAGVDLVPELQKKTGLRSSLLQLFAILIGMGVMVLLLMLE